MGTKSKVGYLRAERVIGNMNLGPGKHLVAPGGIVGVFNTPGHVFFVNHFTGLNTNDGITPDTPFETITYALTQCVAGRDDYIICIDVWDNEPAFPVAVEVPRVHIIGLSNPEMPQPCCAINGGGAFSIFDFDNIWDAEIAGFQCVNAGGAGIALHAVSTALWIHHMGFGETAPIQDGILAVGHNDAPNFSLIENCNFGWQTTRDGIRLPSPTKTVIRRNRFNSLAGGIGIHLGTGIGVGIVGDILDNTFFATIGLALARGWAITIQNGGALITGNRASQTGDATGTNPFFDESTGVLATCLNGWVENYVGGALSAGPAVV